MAAGEKQSGPADPNVGGAARRGPSPTASPAGVTASSNGVVTGCAACKEMDGSLLVFVSSATLFPDGGQGGATAAAPTSSAVIVTRCRLMAASSVSSMSTRKAGASERVAMRHADQ